MCDVFDLIPVVNSTSGITFVPLQVKYSYKRLFQFYILLELLGVGVVKVVTVGNSLNYASLMVLSSIIMSSLCCE